MSLKIKENDIVKIRIGGRVKAVRVIDVCADSAQVELVKSGQCFICQVSELKPICEGLVSRAQERRIRAQLGC
jgi:hypothetical protein